LSIRKTIRKKQSGLAKVEHYASYLTNIKFWNKFKHRSNSDDEEILSNLTCPINIDFGIGNWKKFLKLATQIMHL